MRNLVQERNRLALDRGLGDRVPIPEEISPVVGDVPGIIIADGGLGSRNVLQGSRVRAFVYGERPTPSPTLPFGRWRHAS